MLCPGELGEEPSESGYREIHSQLSQVKLIDDMVCPVLRDQGLGLCRETNTHGTLPLRVKVLGRVLFFPASIPTSTFFLLLAQGPVSDCGFPGSAQGGYTDFQPKQCSQPSLNSTQIFLLHPTPLECRDFQKNSLFSNIWNWFLERGSRASQVPERCSRRS